MHKQIAKAHQESCPSCQGRVDCNANLTDRLAKEGTSATIACPSCSQPLTVSLTALPATTGGRVGYLRSILAAPTGRKKQAGAEA